MTIPGRGDLAPRRRSSYGRRQRRWPRVLLALVVVGALGVGGYYGWGSLRDDDKATVAAGAPCPGPTRTPTAGPPPRVTARVLNGSLETGLARKVAKALHQRFGVTIAKVGNAPRFTRGVSVVHYPSPLAASARALAGYVVPPVRLQKKAGVKNVELDIGTRFRSVAPPPRNPALVPSPSTSPCGTS